MRILLLLQLLLTLSYVIGTVTEDEWNLVKIKEIQVLSGIWYQTHTGKCAFSHFLFLFLFLSLSLSLSFSFFPFSIFYLLPYLYSFVYLYSGSKGHDGDSNTFLKAIKQSGASKLTLKVLLDNDNLSDQWISSIEVRRRVLSEPGWCHEGREGNGFVSQSIPQICH